MGIVGGIQWVNTYSRKQFRKLFWRMRAAMKKAIKNRGKQQFKFQYDPCSYALNFDDGFCKFESRCHVGFSTFGEIRVNFLDWQIDPLPVHVLLRS